MEMWEIQIWKLDKNAYIDYIALYIKRVVVILTLKTVHEKAAINIEP